MLCNYPIQTKRSAGLGACSKYFAQTRPDILHRPRLQSVKISPYFYSLSYFDFCRETALEYRVFAANLASQAGRFWELLWGVQALAPRRSGLLRPAFCPSAANWLACGDLVVGLCMKRERFQIGRVCWIYRSFIEMTG